MKTLNAEQLLTVPEVTDRLRVSRATAYRHIADGSIKTVEAGRGKRATKTRVSELELARFIAARTRR